MAVLLSDIESRLDAARERRREIARERGELDRRRDKVLRNPYCPSCKPDLWEAYMEGFEGRPADAGRGGVTSVVSTLERSK